MHIAYRKGSPWPARCWSARPSGLEPTVDRVPDGCWSPAIGSRLQVPPANRCRRPAGCWTCRAGTCCPGLVDAHQHPSLTAWVPQGTDGIGWPDLPAALAAIRTAVVADARSPWLVFWNALPHTWPQRRLPTAAELDRVAPGRRVLVSVRDLHRVAVSPAALAELGLDAATSWRRSDVARDRRGRPTGELWEHACGAAVATALAQAEQPLGSRQVEAALEAELDRRLGYGYTHVHDAYVPPSSTSGCCGWLGVRRRVCRGRSGRGPGSSLQAPARPSSPPAATVRPAGRPSCFFTAANAARCGCDSRRLAG
jgi:Amidohydrolase family